MFSLAIFQDMTHARDMAGYVNTTSISRFFFLSSQCLNYAARIRSKNNQTRGSGDSASRSVGCVGEKNADG